MVVRHLEWFLESHSLLPESQFGFRRGRGTLDCLSTLKLWILTSFQHRQISGVCFCDVKAAYDSVNITISGERMATLGLPDALIYGVLDLLSHRILYVREGNTLHGPRFTHTGLPQGSILSPLLYIIYTADLDRALPVAVRILQYADDVCIWTAAESIDIVTADLLQHSTSGE